MKLDSRMKSASIKALNHQNEMFTSLDKDWKINFIAISQLNHKLTSNPFNTIIAQREQKLLHSLISDAQKILNLGNQRYVIYHNSMTKYFNNYLKYSQNI